jgi:hypothetical protein
MLLLILKEYCCIFNQDNLPNPLFVQDYLFIKYSEDQLNSSK